VSLLKTLRSIAATVEREVEDVIRLRCIANVDHMHAFAVLPLLSLGRIVSSVATTCEARTRSVINAYNDSTRSATSPHHIPTAWPARSQSLGEPRYLRDDITEDSQSRKILHLSALIDAYLLARGRTKSGAPDFYRRVRMSTNRVCSSM
jgi:hypothetical protein